MLNYPISLPDLTVFMNCDTRLAVNLHELDLDDCDEFIFALKNYTYIGSPCIFLFRARNTDMDENGEVIFKIPPSIAKNLKAKSVYNFSVLVNAFDTTKEIEYRKLSEDGKIIIDYGAQNLQNL